MAFCPQCGAPVNDGAAACPQCGAVMAAAAPQQTQPQPQPQPQYQYQQQFQQVPYQPQPMIDPKDHTAEFDPQDISDNKVVAMCAYLLGTVGIIIALLGAHDSKYAGFHVRQALKIEIVQVLLGILSVVLCWTFIVPIAGAICLVILFVVRIILFFHVAKGKAKDAPIIGNLGFLK